MHLFKTIQVNFDELHVAALGNRIYIYEAAHLTPIDVSVDERARNSLFIFDISFDWRSAIFNLTKTLCVLSLFLAFISVASSGATSHRLHVCFSRVPCVFFFT